MLAIDFRTATQRDIPEITKLWQDVFGDSGEFIDRCLYDYAGLDQVYLAFSGQELVSQLLAVPCVMNSLLDQVPGVYLCALATRADYRGRGAMSRLMEFAEQRSTEQGKAFSILIPASKDLFGFYARMRYDREVMTRRVELALPKKAGLNVDFRTVTGLHFRELRRKYAGRGQSFVDFGTKQYAVIVKDLYANDTWVARTDKAYAVYTVQGDRLLVPELFASHEEEAKELLRVIAYKTGCENFVLQLGEGSGLFEEQGESRAFGLMKSLDYGFAVKNIYLRFGMEDSTLWE